MQHIVRRATKHYRQINHARPEKVFLLLCPVMEAEWIDGWQHEMIYSQSGVAEQGCVFVTSSPSGAATTWYVTLHDPENFRIEFVRMTPGEMVVAILIQLSTRDHESTFADITYEYTSLTDSAATWIVNELDASFEASMVYWEKAINHFLSTGRKLLKS